MNLKKYLSFDVYRRTCMSYASRQAYRYLEQAQRLKHPVTRARIPPAESPKAAYDRGLCRYR